MAAAKSEDANQHCLQQMRHEIDDRGPSLYHCAGVDSPVFEYDTEITIDLCEPCLGWLASQCAVNPIGSEP